MIHKIEKLVSIGKFRNYQATGDVAFRKLTLVYGDNGSGKTTITAVLRSLTQNDPEIIRKRISTKSTTPQATQIIQRDAAGKDTFHTFGATGWTIPFSDFEIFDIHFVNNNIYSGFDFNDEHKKQLHQFVIGAQAVSIQQEIDLNKAAKTLSRQTQTKIENQIIETVSNDLTVDSIGAFLNIPVNQASSIDTLIVSAEAALTVAKSNALIQSLQRPARLGPINTVFDFTAIIADLQTTTQAIQDAALQTVFEDHCADLAVHTIDGPETWLRTGFDYLKNKNDRSGEPVVLACPFCKQPVGDHLDVIKAYALRFNDEFNALVQRVQGHITALQSFNLDSNIQVLNNANQNNTERINAWAKYLPADVNAPVYNVIGNEALLKAEFQALITAAQQKALNPSMPVDTTSAMTFQTSLQLINTNISAYNQSVTAYNNAISTFSGGIQTEQQAQDEANRMKRIKRRFEPAIVALCTQLVTEKRTEKDLEQAYKRLMVLAETTATQFFARYKDRINHYLNNVFRTPFKIDNVVHIPPQGKGKESKIGYKLTIDGHDISFDPSRPHSAKDCLSEGDKSTIALSFFLSKLDIDQNTKNKILIFDDPISSFDSHRRLYTASIIKGLLQLMTQVVVFSHNEHFLHELSKDIAAGDKKTLRITENFLAKESIIEPLTLETLVENDYFKHIKELENFLQNADINKKDTILGLMRNVLEAHIRFKFYRQTSHMAATNRTFGHLITELVNQSVIFRDHTNQASIITKLKLINGISCKPHHGEPVPDYAVLGADPNAMTVVELANFVQDTLELIDDKL